MISDVMLRAIRIFKLLLRVHPRARRRSLHAFLVISAVTTTGPIALASSHPTHCDSVALAIRAKYENLLSTLDLDERRHFAVRLYRTTGDTAYYPSIRADEARAEDELKRDLAGANDEKYVKKRTDTLLTDFNKKTRKGNQRWHAFEKRRRMLFDLNILANVKRVTEHVSADQSAAAIVQQGLDYLQEIDFRDCLLSESIIRVYSPQAVNYVYYLNDLRIADLRHAYGDAFRRVFPDDRDVRLSRLEFRDKIYGMTHFIFAASDYYQHRIDSTDYAWILDYFATHIDRIAVECTSDIIAEVGICFLLAGAHQHPALERCRSLICSRFDPDKRMLVSPHGSDDVILGEHRNVLASMLLDWPDTLRPGPILSEH